MCSSLGIDPLKLISSGTLIVAVEKGGEEQVRDAVASVGSTISPIGRLNKGKVTIARSQGSHGGDHLQVLIWTTDRRDLEAAREAIRLRIAIHPRTLGRRPGAPTRGQVRSLSLADLQRAA